jgi:hypothetical protein
MPYTATGWPGRQPNQRYTPQTVPGVTRPILKEVFLELNLGRRLLKIWIFVANIRDESILGLDILRAFDASVNLARQMLRLTEEALS